MSHEASRYIRHLSLPGFGEDQQVRLRKSDVLVIGAGGLGAPAITYLAAAGVGCLRIVDDDVVETSNLARQVLFDAGDVGRSKAEAAANRVSRLNPDVQVVPINERFTSETAPDLLKEATVVLDCSDNLPTRYTIQRAAMAAGIPCVWAAVGQFWGHCSVVLPDEGACFECIFGPEELVNGWPTARQAGMFSPVCGVMGALAAGEAIKVITGVGEPLVNRMALADTATGELGCLPVVPDPGCSTHKAYSPATAASSRI